MSVGVTFLQPVQVKALLEDPSGGVMVLDVRDDDFLGDGHIKNCINIPSYQLSDQAALDTFIEKRLIPSKVHTLVVHCYLSQQRGPLTARR